MSERWLSLADAASELGVSVRRLRRRVAAGEFHMRQQNGRRELLLRSRRATERAGATGAAVAPYHLNSSNIASGEAGETPGGHAHQAAARTPAVDWQAQRQWIEFTRAQLAAAQRSARLAWTLVLMLVAGGGAGLWWATRTMTQADSDIRQLNGQVQGWTLQSQAMASEIERLQKALGRAPVGVGAEADMLTGAEADLPTRTEAASRERGSAGFRGRGAAASHDRHAQSLPRLPEHAPTEARRLPRERTRSEPSVVPPTDPTRISSGRPPDDPS